MSDELMNAPVSLNSTNALSYGPNKLHHTNRSIRRVTSVSAPPQRGEALTAAFVIGMNNI
jgi:hypothetical protein